MGSPKEWLPFGDETMLARVARILAHGVSPITIVAARGQKLPPLSVPATIVHDRSPGRGPLEGLAVGLRSLVGRCHAAYVTSCDVPLLTWPFIAHVIAALEGHDIAVPRTGRYHHPLAAVYRLRVLGVIERLLREDRLRPFFLFGEVDTREILEDELRQADPRLDSLRNVNSPEEYAQALRDAGVAPFHETGSY